MLKLPPKKKSFVAMGIDPSATATGIVVLRANNLSVPETAVTKEITPKKLTGMQRALFIVDLINEEIKEHNPDVIVIEGYSLNMKNASSVVPLVEIGGLLRATLFLRQLKWYDPRASELKQFATGKGNSTKDVIMMNVFKRWQYEAPTNNLADAYVLAIMGLGLHDKIPGLTKEMLTVLGKLSLKDN